MRPEEPRWPPRRPDVAARRSPHVAPEPPSGRGQGAGGSGDAYHRHRSGEADVPHWLIAMSAERASGRQHLDPATRQRAAEVERAWLAGWVSRLPPRVEVPPATASPAERLLGWQQCVNAMCEAAGADIGRPHVVWQPAMGIHRGQYLFRVDGGLLQLRPNAAGSDRDWLATVAHETYHHAQHALLVALYQGRPAWPAPFDLLAAYFRDARNVYRGEGPECPPPAHRQQLLELGAWRFGQLVGERAGPPG